MQVKRPGSRRPPLRIRPEHFQPVEEELAESPAEGEEGKKERAEEEEGERGRPPDLQFPVPPFLEEESGDQI